MIYDIYIEHLRPTQKFIDLLNRCFQGDCILYGLNDLDRIYDCNNFNVRLVISDDLKAAVVYNSILNMINHLMRLYGPGYIHEGQFHHSLYYNAKWEKLYEYFSINSEYMEMTLSKESGIDLIYKRYKIIDGQYRIWTPTVS